MQRDIFRRNASDDIQKAIILVPPANLLWLRQGERLVSD